MTTELQLEVGRVLAERYEIRQKLGRGGMGSVYLVYDQKTGREVALKMLHAKYAGSKYAIARFIREVTTARSLNHPGIVKIFDACKSDNILFYTMEYVEGKTVRQWLQERHRLEFKSVVRVLCLVADALSHAHKITIHRDLSPENIMVMRNGSIRLLDFGLAKLDDQFKGLTVVGTNLGKFRYTAPEQQLDPAKVDYRADLFSLGVMFFELLTGRAPHPGHRLSQLCPGLPSGADAFAEKAMAPDPDKRFQTAVEFRDALLELYRSSRGASEQDTVLRKSPKQKWYQRIFAFFSVRARSGQRKNGDKAK